MEYLKIFDPQKIIYNQGGLYFDKILDLDFFQLIISISIIFLSYFYIKKLANKLLICKNSCIILHSYHLIFFIIFFLFSIQSVNDFDSFYQKALFLQSNEYNKLGFVDRKGVFPMLVLNYFLIHFMGLKYFNIHLLGAVLSSISIIFLYKIIYDKLKETKFKKYLLFILLLPTIHFWTASMTKECLIISFVIFAFYNIYRKNYFLSLFFTFLIIVFRVHVGYIFLFLLLIFYSLIFLKNIKIKIDFLITMLLLITFFAIFILIVKLSGLSDYFINFLERGSNIRYANSFFDGHIETYGINNFILTIKFIFFPLYNFSTFKASIISLENIIVVFLISYLIVKEKIFLYSNSLLNLFLLFLVISISFVLSNFISNTGIISRQKIIITISLILIIVNCLNIKYKK